MFNYNEITVFSKINRVSVDLPTGNSAIFCIIDTDQNALDIKRQFELAFFLSSSFSDVERHLQINGINVELEDIY